MKIVCFSLKKIIIYKYIITVYIERKSNFFRHWLLDDTAYYTHNIYITQLNTQSRCLGCQKNPEHIIL